MHNCRRNLFQPSFFLFLHFIGNHEELGRLVSSIFSLPRESVCRFHQPAIMGRSGSCDSSKAFSKPTDIRPTIRSVGRTWYTPLVGPMLEDNLSKRCS